MIQDLPTWPAFSAREGDIVSSVLTSNKVNYWTGDEGRQFESEFASFANTQYAIALANGTLALDIALRALEVGPGDEVIVTPRSFMASASCVSILGATPIFADVDPDSQNISAQTIREVITDKTKAVIVVHLSGMPAEMDPIMALANEHDFYVIEDCAQAHGAKYQNSSVGSIGHIGTWSFCQDKILTTGGEGGMVTTNDGELWEKMWSFKDHGKSYDAVYNQQHPIGFRWLHNSIGTNYRMTEMQSALGRYQLTKLDEWLVQRTQNAQVLMALESDFPVLKFQKPPTHMTCAYYKLPATLELGDATTSTDRDNVMRDLNERGIPCFSTPCPEIYMEIAFAEHSARDNPLPNAKSLGEKTLQFLVHPTLTLEHMRMKSKVIGEVLAELC
jgi:dTDP-4-amino-4,6-dideoxygalactose transaminase